MMKCPVCSQDVATPFILNVDAWRWLVCRHCGARLEQKKSRYVAALVALLLVVISVSRLLGHRYAAVAYGLLVLVAGSLLVALLQGGLQVRKPLPEPEIRLKISE